MRDPVPVAVVVVVELLSSVVCSLAACPLCARLAVSAVELARPVEPVQRRLELHHRCQSAGPRSLERRESPKRESVCLSLHSAFFVLYIAPLPSCTCTIITQLASLAFFF